MQKTLLLLGAGHAHVHVLKSWAQSPLAGVALKLITPSARALYSGMVPGLIAKRYTRVECEIDVAALAQAARCELLLGETQRIDAIEQRVTTSSGERVGFDILSINTGSASHALRHALQTRPIDQFVEKLEREILKAPARIALMGAGAAAVEIAFALRARLPHARLELYAPKLLEGFGARTKTRVAEAMSELKIQLHTGLVKEVLSKQGFRFEHKDAKSSVLDCDLLIAALGAAPPNYETESLAKDERGFLHTHNTFALRGMFHVFAVGDAASLEQQPLPKSGVFAVRAGPLLDKNLRAALQGTEPKAFKTSRTALALINCGDGTAIASYGPFAQRSRFWMQRKDAIDRAFIQRHELST